MQRASSPHSQRGASYYPESGTRHDGRPWLGFERGQLRPNRRRRPWGRPRSRREPGGMSDDPLGSPDERLEMLDDPPASRDERLEMSDAPPASRCQAPTHVRRPPRQSDRAPRQSRRAGRKSRRAWCQPARGVNRPPACPAGWRGAAAPRGAGFQPAVSQGFQPAPDRKSVV